MTTRSWQDAPSGGYGTLTRGPDRTGYRYLRLSLADEQATAVANWAAHYRRRARQCLKLANAVPRGEAHDTVIAMAREWANWAQIIPLKARVDSQDPSRIPAMETTRV